MGSSATISARGSVLRKSGPTGAKTLSREDFPADLAFWKSLLYLWPLRCPSEGRRDRKKLDADEIADRFIRPGDSTYVPDASINGDFSSFELQMERLHRLWGHRHWRR